MNQRKRTKLLNAYLDMLEDIYLMSHAQRGRELRRMARLVLTFALAEDHAKCWHRENKLVNNLLRQTTLTVGQMRLPKEVLKKGCDKYITRQQCFKHGCTGRTSPRKKALKRSGK